MNSLGVVITGASSGIGAELALQYARWRRASLVLAARRLDRLRQVQKKAYECGAQYVLVVQTDVQIEEQCIRLIEKSIACLGRIDLLILNAGIGMNSAFHHIQHLHHFSPIMHTNYFGVLYPLYHAWKHLSANKSRVGITSSIVALRSAPGQSVYVASKHALEGLVKSVRQELGCDEFTISVVYPSAVCTEIFEKLRLGDGSLSGEEGTFSKYNILEYIHPMPVEAAAEEYYTELEKKPAPTHIYLDEYNRIGHFFRPFSKRIADFLTYLSLKIPHGTPVYSLPLRFAHAISEARKFQSKLTQFNTEDPQYFQTMQDACMKMEKHVNINEKIGATLDKLPEEDVHNIISTYVNDDLPPSHQQ